MTLTATAVVAALAAWLVVPSGGVAQELLPSVSAPTDLVLLGLAGGQTPATVPVQHNPEPPLEATPRAVCGPGSHPLDGMQGRVPASAIDSPAAANGYSCNLTLIAHQGETGGFKVLRYVDPQGHECAYYDTTLLFPLNALRLNGSSLGVAVLDIRDPLHPREIAYYIAPPHHAPENLEDGSNFAMSKPAFAPERREIWYTDGSSGFYVLRLPPSLWPDPS